jgi:purine-binding chemotaxis protein CheW
MDSLTFRAAEATLGIPMDDVQEILDSWTLTPLPLLPHAFRGVTDLRGTPVPVADVNRLVGGTSEAHRRTLVVLRSSVALLVDAIDNVIQVDRLEPARMSRGGSAGPPTASKSWREKAF